MGLVATNLCLGVGFGFMLVELLFFLGGFVFANFLDRQLGPRFNHQFRQLVEWAMELRSSHWNTTRSWILKRSAVIGNF
jgi:hypothetical protein